MENRLKRCLVIGLAFLSMSLAACGNGNPSTTLPASIDLHITVTSQNRTPLSGAKVVSQEQPEGQLKITGLTDSQGRVTFNRIKPGVYAINISRFDYDPIEVTREITASDHDFTVTLKPSAATPPPTSVPNLTFNELISQPASFNNRYVTVDAYYFSGFEISALAASLVASTYNPSNVTPVQPLIWVTGDLGQSVYPNLKQQTNTPSGYTEYYGRVRITGLFQFGARYGHLDAFNYLITVNAAAILP
jgi:hypothetical protein